jgi:hypothetical protein
MSCSIDVDISDGQASFSKEDIVKARKEYKCCECGDVIKIGEKYEKFRGKFEGGFSEYKTCLICKEIRDHIFCSWFFECVWEDLSEYTNGGYDFDYSMIDGLSVAAIEKIENYFEEEWNKEE